MEIKLLLLLMKSAFLVTSTQNVKWLVGELDTFHTVSSCLTDICRDPRFRLTITVDGNQLLTSAIRLNQTPVDGVYDRVVFNPMQQVELSALKFSAEIVGTDPTFNFMRICDSSAIEELSKYAKTQNENELTFRLEVQGKCFKASAALSVHSKHCPWCLFDATSITTNEDRSTGSISTTFLLLVGICVASAVAIALLVLVCVYLYKSNRELQFKRTDTTSSPSTQITESHYDLPWKPTSYRNLRLVRNPYETSNPPDELIGLSPGFGLSPEHASFAVCLGTTHRANERLDYSLCKSFESSGRGSV